MKYESIKFSTKIFFFTDKRYCQLCKELLLSNDYIEMKKVENLIHGSFCIISKTDSFIKVMSLKERARYEGETPGMFGSENEQASDLVLNSLLMSNNQN